MKKIKDTWAYRILDDIKKVIYFSCEIEIVAFLIYGWNDALSGTLSK